MPPPYGSTSESNSWTTGAAPLNGSPMVTCRVCQALIDISGKKDQHVVKCAQCHEATVGYILFLNIVFNVCIHRFFYSV